jgi:two-component system chemotaxis response regulator CheB
MIKVLIVEDSQVVRDFLTYILSSDPDIHVIGTASNGEEAIQAVRDRRPDVVTMDINMPKMDGFEATRIIMETTPTPIVIVSASWDPKEVERTFRAMEAGALAAVRKPVGVAHPDYKDQAKELTQAVKLMSEVKVVRRRLQVKLKNAVLAVSPFTEPASKIPDVKVVAIGASTGGPPVIETILSGLPKDSCPPPPDCSAHCTGFCPGVCGMACKFLPVPSQRCRTA